MKFRRNKCIICLTEMSSKNVPLAPCLSRKLVSWIYHMYKWVEPLISHYINLLIFSSNNNGHKTRLCGIMFPDQFKQMGCPKYLLMWNYVGNSPRIPKVVKNSMMIAVFFFFFQAWMKNVNTYSCTPLEVFSS